MIVFLEVWGFICTIIGGIFIGCMMGRLIVWVTEGNLKELLRRRFPNRHQKEERKMFPKRSRSDMNKCVRCGAIKSISYKIDNLCDLCFYREVARIGPSGWKTTYVSNDRPKIAQPVPTEKVDLPLTAHRKVVLRPGDNGIYVSSPKAEANSNLLDGSPAVCLGHYSPMINSYGDPRCDKAPTLTCSCGYYSVPLGQELGYDGLEALVLIGGKIIEEETENGITYRSSHLTIQEIQVPPCTWCGRKQSGIAISRKAADVVITACYKHLPAEVIILDESDLEHLNIPVRFLEGD